MAGKKKQEATFSTLQEANEHARILREAFWSAVKSIGKVSTVSCVVALRSVLYALKDDPSYEEAELLADQIELRLRCLEFQKSKKKSANKKQT